MNETSTTLSSRGPTEEALVAVGNVWVLRLEMCYVVCASTSPETMSDGVGRKWMWCCDAKVEDEEAAWARLLNILL
jgi:hypothetical protein